MESSGDFDTVLVSAAWYVDDESQIPDHVRSVAERITARIYVSLAMSLGHFAIDGNDAVQRRRDFLAASANLLDGLHRAGLVDRPR